MVGELVMVEGLGDGGGVSDGGGQGDGGGLGDGVEDSE